MRDSFSIFRSTFEALKAFPPDDMKAALIMMGEYAMDGITPEPEGTAAYGLFCSVRPLIDRSNRRSEAGRAGGKQTEANCKQTEANVKQSGSKLKQSGSKPEANGSKLEAKEKEESRKEKDIKEIEKESVKKERRFAPPTPDEVRDYAQTHGYNCNAERFCDYYESKGWLVGKARMKDWKAAVRNWSRNQRQGETAKGTKFSNFKQRGYDMDDLERKLLGV